MRTRIIRCALTGLVVAAIAAWWSATHRHAELTAVAAHGHETTRVLLVAAFVITAAVVTVTAFVLASAGRKRNSRGRRRPRRRGRGRAYSPGGG